MEYVLFLFPPFPYFRVDPHFCQVLHCISLKVSFNISFRANLLAISSLNFCLSESLYFSFSFEGYFPELPINTPVQGWEKAQEQTSVFRFYVKVLISEQ